MTHRPTSPFYFTPLLFICLLFPAVIAAAPRLTPFEVDYLIERNGMALINMHRALLATANGEYRFESRSTPTSMLSWLFKDHIYESSLWRYEGDNPRPQVYRYKRRGGRKKENVELVFDWTENTVSDKRSNPLWSTSIPPQTTDKLLYQLQLMLDLQTESQNIDYTIADSGKLRHYHYEIIGSETLKLDTGIYETIKLYRDVGRRSTTIWCALKLNYLPVRIEHMEKDGSRMQANVTHIKGLPLMAEDN